MSLVNKQVKEFLSKLTLGSYTLEKQLRPPFPTISRRTSTVSAKTADYTVTLADLNTPKIFSNTGAAGTIVLTLPSVASSKNKVLFVNVLAAQIVRCLPQTGEIVNLNGSVVATKYLNIAGVIGNYAELFCDGTHWIVTGYSGVLTKEA